MNNPIDLQERISETARDVFKINFLRPFQTLIVTNIVEPVKRPNLLAILPTGGGKSLCFMLPSVMLDGLTVIIYPILSLMHDQKKRFDALSIPALVLKGGMDPLEKAEIFNQLRQKKAKVLITNMEMLAQPRIQDQLKGMHISLLVLDEAHTVISWGRTFRPVYKELGNIASSLEPDRIIAFTATSDKETTESLKKEVLGSNAMIVFGGLDRENIIYHRVHTVFPLLDIISLLEKEESRPAIIFTQSRSLVDSISKKLSPIFTTYAYHAGLNKERRVEIEKAFMADSSGVMVATCAYGMGVDKADIRTCIHYGLPQSAADYLQESGRIARDGGEGHAYAFLNNSFLASPLEELFSKDLCLRESLVKAMGQSLFTSCAGCDVCDKKKIKPAGLEEVRKLLKIPYLFKKATLVRILRHRKTFSILSEWEIEKGIEKLIKAGRIKLGFNRVRWVK